MNRFSKTQSLFVVASAAIAAIGIFHDPDTANADEITGGTVPHERMPGYQAVPNVLQHDSLTQAELAKLNAPVDGVVTTF